MNARIVAAAILGLAICLLPGLADACTRKVSQTAVRTIVPESGINQNLLDAAIRNEVNYHRCRSGLGNVRDAGDRLSREAEKHSIWMAKSQKLSHTSTVSGAATLSQRVKRSGVSFRAGSENIGMVHRYQIDNRHFKILNSSACQFESFDGQPLPAHSYATLARHIVNLWMASDGHRKNILDRRVSMVSTAVAFDKSAQYCGRYWLTQNFIG